MNISVKIEKNPISILKLHDGTEVAGVIKRHDEHGIILKDAMTIKYKIDYTYNKPVIYLSKYSPFSKSYEVKFEKEHVMHVFRDPIEEFVDYYNKYVKKLKNKDVKWDIQHTSKGDLHNKLKVEKTKLNHDEQQQIMDAFEELLTSNTSIN